MTDTPYQNRELDEKFADIKDSLTRIEAQTTKTNGHVAELTNRMNRTDKILLVVGTAVCSLLATNSNEVIGFIRSIL